MGITLAGGAEFPHFDRLVTLGQWIVILGFLLHLGAGIARLFRGAAPEILPAIAKAGLGFATLALLPAIGEGAFQAGGELAEAIAGPARIDALKLAISGALISVIDDQGAFDMVSIEFWLSMATVLCTSFAYISKYIILEVLWPLYLGLVVVGGAISIPLGTIPGMKTAQAWVLTLLEAISWPVIFQVLLSVIAAVTLEHVDQVVSPDGEFLAQLEGLATLCAVSLLTIMTPLIAARAMRGEGASAAMSFIAGKAAFMVSGLASRAAVGAITGPAKLGMRAAGVGARGGLPRAGGGSGGPSPAPPSPATSHGSGSPAGGAAPPGRPARRPLRRAQASLLDQSSAKGAAPRPAGSQSESSPPHGAPSDARSSAPASTDVPQLSARSAASATPAAQGPSVPAGTKRAAGNTAREPKRKPAGRGGAPNQSTPRPSQPGPRANTPQASRRSPPQRTQERAPSTPTGAHPQPSAPARTRQVDRAPSTERASDLPQLGEPASAGAPSAVEPAPMASASPSADRTAPRARPAQSSAPIAAPRAPSSRGRPAVARSGANPPRLRSPAPTPVRPAGAERDQPRTRQTPAGKPARYDWDAAERAPQAAQQPTARRRFYNIKGSTKEATAALISAKKAGDLDRAQRIREIVKAHPVGADHASKVERRDLIRRAIERLDEPGGEDA